MQNEDIKMIAYEIIAFSGEATDFYYKALSSYKKNDEAEANQFIEKGDESLNKAHKKQMDLIVNETNGSEIPYCIIMEHAQDHLMNAMTVKNMVKELGELYALLKTR
ncbi:MAG: PTS lactose/cellobiose transporter subunit IIA [Erysipelotrichia bacterium]|nr:PTS lactose/cellobiose transporter subunit IIA [Erysipelotrichia bacterium]